MTIPDSGSPLFFERRTRSLTALMVGSLDDPNIFKPELQVCLESAMTWLEDLEKAPHFSEKPEGMTPLVDYDSTTGALTESSLNS